MAAGVGFLARAGWWVGSPIVSWGLHPGPAPEPALAVRNDVTLYRVVGKDEATVTAVAKDVSLYSAVGKDRPIG